MLEFQYRVSTPDNWYPTNEDGKVTVSGFVEHSWARISVWGDDDFGLELEVHLPTHECKVWYRAWKKYFEACSEITQAQLRAFGFKNA